MQDAGCRGMGQDMFFPKRGGGQRKAKKVCEACVVRTDCRDYAERTNTHYGIWGGEVLKRWGDNGSASDNQSDGQIDLGLVLENEVVETLADFATSATVPPLPGTVGTVRNGQKQDFVDFVHAIDCDLDEDCSCEGAFSESPRLTPEIPPDINSSGDHPFDKQATTVLIIDAPSVSPGATSLEIQYVSSSSETVSSHEVEVAPLPLCPPD